MPFELSLNAFKGAKVLLLCNKSLNDQIPPRYGSINSNKS